MSTSDFETQRNEAVAAVEELVAAAELALTEIQDAALSMTLKDAIATGKEVVARVEAAR